MPSDNAAAVGQIANSLGDLGNYIYRQSVVKPAVQAQTAATQAGTAGNAAAVLRQEAQTYQQSTAPLQKLNVAAQTRAGQMDIKNLYMGTVQKPSIDKVAPAFPDRTTDADGNPIPNPSLQVPYSEARAKGFVSEGDEPLTQAEINSGIQTPDARPAVSDTASVPLDASIPFIRQPKMVQDVMVNQVIKENPSSIPMTRGEAKAALAARDYQDATSTLPPITPYTLPGGLGITKLSGGPAGVSYEAAQTGATPVLDTTTGGRSGQMMVNGNLVNDPNMVPAKDVGQYTSEINDFQASQKQARNIQDILNANPSLVGANLLTGSHGGTELAQKGRKIGSYVGASPNIGKQNQIQQFLSKQLINTLNQIHIGRVTELELGYLKNNIPSQDAPKDVWDDYMNRYQDALSKSIEERQDILRQNGTPYTPGNPYSSQLPPVTPATGVTPPETSRVGDSSNAGSTGGASASPLTVNSAAELQAAAKAGKKQIIFNGKLYSK